MTREEFYKARRDYRAMRSAISWVDEDLRDNPGASLLHSMIWDRADSRVRYSVCRGGYVARPIIEYGRRVDMARLNMWCNTRCI